MNKKILFFPSMEIKKTDRSSQTAEFTFEHLDLGLAATLGNTFRRLLLTQVPGWAIFAVKISDKEKTIASEFEKLKGITEIPLYLIFNLKKLVFLQSSQKEFSLPEQETNSLICTLQINIDNSQNKEAYVVTGKDVQGDLKVINPEVYLATVEANSQLKIELHCRYYWDSSVAKEQRSLLAEKTNVIFLPSDYCPVKIVSWKAEPVIIDLNKQEEKLTLTITTNGSISAQDSLLRAASFLEQMMIDIQQQLTAGKKMEAEVS